MLKTTILAAAAFAIVGVTGVQAQSIQLGPNGPAVDLRNDAQRERDYRREQRGREADRARYDRDQTGSTGRCRTVTVREQDDYGRMVTRETRDCN